MSKSKNVECVVLTRTKSKLRRAAPIVVRFTKDEYAVNTLLSTYAVTGGMEETTPPSNDGIDHAFRTFKCANGDEYDLRAEVIEIFTAPKYL